MAVFGEMVVQMLNYGFVTLKRHILSGTASFDVFCVKIHAGVLGDLKNLPKNIRVNFGPDGAQNRACAEKKPPDSTWIKFCDLSTVHFCCRSAGSQILPFPLTLIVVLTTLARTQC